MALPPNGSEDQASPVQGEVRELAKLVAGISEVEVLAIAYLLWRQKALTGNQSLREIARAIGVGKDTVYDRLQRFEQMFHVSPAQEADDLLYHKIRDLLDRFEDIRGLRPGSEDRPLTIALGASPGLCNSWVRQVVLPFMRRHSVDATRVAINLVSEMPRRLREDGAKGLLDLYITSWPEGQEPADEGSTRIDLKLQLICPYGHPALDHPGRGALARTTVLVLAPHEDRVPCPLYPMRALVDAGARVEEVLSYDSAYNRMRLGDSRIACFGLVEILSEEDHREFVGVRLEDVGLEPMRPIRICMVPSERARRRQGPELTQLVDELAASFRTFLRDIRKPLIPDDLLDRLNDRRDPWRLYHVRRVGLAGRSFWARGEVHWRFSRDGSVRGTHQVELREVRDSKHNEQKFRIYGKMMVNGAYKECHLAWQGVFEVVDDPTGAKAPETYDASFVFPQEDLERRETLVGVWQGRRTYASDEGSDHYLPDWGYIVLSRLDLPREAKWARWLANEVNTYKQECGITDSKEDFPIPKNWEEDLLVR